jgi:molybdopterin converting factor small subunit
MEMRIKLKLVGFAEAERLIGGKEVDLQLEGSTFGDLLVHLQKRYGESVVKGLRQQILRNGEEWIRRDDLHHSLQDGDRLTFLRMMGGG